MPSTDRARHVAAAAVNRIHGCAAHIVSAAMTCHEDQLIVIDVSSEGEVVIAVIPTLALREHVLTSTDGYCTVTFKKGVPMDGVEERCLMNARRCCLANQKPDTRNQKLLCGVRSRLATPNPTAANLTKGTLASSRAERA